MPIIAIPQTEDEWLSHVRGIVPSTAANWIETARAANALVQDGEVVMDRAFFNRVADGVTSLNNREAMIDSLVEAWAGTTEPDEVEVEVNEPLEEEIRLALLTIHPRSNTWSAMKRTAVIKTAAYQHGNWTAGRYVVASTDEAVKQFARRLKREFPAVEFQPDTFVYSALMFWLRTKVGTGVGIIRKPIPGSVYEVEAIIDSNVEAMGLESVDSYTISRSLINILGPTDGRDVDYDEVLTAFERDIRRRTTDEKTIGDGEVVCDWFLENYLGAVAAPVKATIPIDGIVDAFVTAEGEIEPFYLEAVRNGVLDTIDQIKEDEIPEARVVDALRLNVRSYGHYRFTGGGRKNVRGMLAAAEALRGAGLTPEEWKIRWNRFRVRLGAVSGRYGEVHRMCERLEAATAELGAFTTRHPEGRTVTFTSADLVIRVPVETWQSDLGVLREKAQAKWNEMTPEERKAAVVEQKGVHVNWASMAVK